MLEFTQSKTGQAMKFGTSAQDMMIKKMQTPTQPSLFSSPPPSLLNSPSQEIPCNDTIFLTYLKRFQESTPAISTEVDQVIHHQSTITTSPQTIPALVPSTVQPLSLPTSQTISKYATSKEKLNGN